MRFYIVDDDSAIRAVLHKIIEDEDLGELVGEAASGEQLTSTFLNFKGVDILFIDLLMPIRDGIETIRHLLGSFNGKIIMISQVESKELIARAYKLGVEYYILKPVNRIEIVTIVEKVIARIQMERSFKDIQNSLNKLMDVQGTRITSEKERSWEGICDFLLTELGITGETGAADLINVLEYLYSCEHSYTFEHSFPSLKDIFRQTAKRKLGPEASDLEINREIKAAEQRIRRAVLHSIIHFASLGLTDYSHPSFETYAARFFDFEVVRKKMRELQEHSLPADSSTKINTKKFIQIFYFEVNRLKTEH